MDSISEWYQSWTGRKPPWKEIKRKMDIEQIMAQMPRAENPHLYTAMQFEGSKRISKSNIRHHTYGDAIEAQCRLDAQWILDHRQVPSEAEVILEMAKLNPYMSDSEIVRKSRVFHKWLMGGGQ